MKSYITMCKTTAVNKIKCINVEEKYIECIGH